MLTNFRKISAAIMIAGIVLPTQVFADQKPANAVKIIKKDQKSKGNGGGGLIAAGTGVAALTSRAPDGLKCKAGDKKCLKKAQKVPKIGGIKGESKD